jgi:menaquinone reductase, molybdopterin-binding-like subunit
MVVNAAGPVMRPLYQTRATPDVLIDVAAKLKTPLSLPWKSYDEALKASFDRINDTAWDAVAEKGGYWAEPSAGGSRQAGDSRQAGNERRATRSQPPAASSRFIAPEFDGDPATYPFHFLPYPSQAFGDGSTAHLPWLQEMPDPLTSAMWSSWVEINPTAADKLQIRQGDIVEIASSQGVVRAPAVMAPGIAPDVIAMPVGQGHETFTRYASGRGVNPIAILAPMAESETGALAWAATRVKIARIGGHDGSLIMFAGEMRESPHEHETR